MKRSQPSRDWRDANTLKRGPCRICGTPDAELAHLSARVHDPYTRPGSKTRYVRPDSVIPLCSAHHRAFDAHELSVLPVLTLEEQVCVVSDLGLYMAYIRVCSISRAERAA